MCTSAPPERLRYTLTPPLKDLISVDPDTHSAFFIPIILGSDKMTVSVATGQQEYHPIYLSIGHVHNHL